MENKSSGTKTNTNANAKKSDPSKIILIGIIILLGGVIGYMVFSSQKQGEEIVSKDQAIDSLKSEQDQTFKDLKELKARYEKLAEEKDALGLESASLREKIEELDQALAASKSKNYREVEKWKKKLTDLQGDYIKMKDDYEALIRTNDTLRFRVDSLHRKTVAMEDSVANLSMEKSELAEKVAIASVLKAENVNVSVINPKGKEISDDIYKAKVISKLKVAFNLGDNKVAKKEPKEIYFRLIEPNGSTLFEGDKIFKVNGREAFYTEKKTINFDNTRQPVTFIYNKGSAYKPGKYSVEFYADGTKIGESQFAVK